MHDGAKERHLIVPSVIFIVLLALLTAGAWVLMGLFGPILAEAWGRLL